MSQGGAKLRPPFRLCLVWGAFFATALLALTPGPVLGARRAFVGDLESNDVAADANGRRKLLDSDGYEIFDSFEYDILEVVNKEYDAAIGCTGYGGYAVYGYYGHVQGSYGSYQGEPFSRISADFEDELISVEVDTEDFMNRRVMQALELEEELVDYPIYMEQEAFDYAIYEDTNYIAVYGGVGDAIGYGSVQLRYVGYYGGGMELDAESQQARDELLMEVGDQLIEEAYTEAYDDLMENIRNRNASYIIPKDR